MNLLKKYFFSYFILVVNYVYSQNDSIIVSYNWKGIKTQEGRLKDGKKQGEWKFYNDSLNYLTKIENYENGYPSGEFIEYNSKGIIILKGHHSINAIVFYTGYDKETGGKVSSYKALPVGDLLYYSDSILIKKEIYNDKGELISTWIKN